MWYGKIPWIKETEITEQEADDKLKAFIIDFSERQINWKQLRR
jgi:hypothetical protein